MLSDDDDDDYLERRKGTSEKTYDIDPTSMPEKSTKTLIVDQDQESREDPIKDNRNTKVKEEMTNTNRKEKSPKPRKSSSGGEENSLTRDHKIISTSNEAEYEEDKTFDKKQSQSRTHKLFDSIRHSTIRRNKSRGKHDTAKADKQSQKETGKNNNSKNKEGLILVLLFYLKQISKTDEKILPLGNFH